MTKLFVPQVHPDMVVRARIVQRLEEGLRRRLTLISAPAGFGKTTLVSDWHHSGSRDDVAVAWLSLDERDNDTGRFLTYLVEAFHLANPEIGDDARVLTTSMPNVQPELILTRLINSVGYLSGQVALVLDDYHVIENPGIHNAMDFFIEHLPPQLHVILTCRTDPPLSLARLRVRGEVIDIGAEDLRFTVQETTDFLQNAIGRDIGAGDILELERRTEGWAAGLQLAAISLRDRDDVHAFIHSFSGQHHHIVDYLVDEVLNRQPVATQEFLLRTSLFDRFTADLCDAVTRRGDSHAMLESLERSNLFITALDSERRWFRYHHLFAGVLRRKLRQAQPDVILDLHRRASIWFEEHGDPIEAIWQSINGEDWRRAGDLIEANERLLFSRGQSRALLRLTQAVPNEVVLSRPWLLNARAWAQILNGEVENSRRDLTALVGLIERIERDPSRAGEISEIERGQIRGSLAAARAMNSILANDFEATLKFSDEALGQLPEEDIGRRSMTKGVRAQALWLSGDLQSSADASREMIELSKLTEAPLFRIIGLLTVGSIEVEWGHFDRAAALYEQAIDYAEGRGLSNWQYVGRVLSFQSEIPYERNDLEEALDIAKRGREIAGHWASRQAYDVTYLHLARVHYARRDLDSARSVLSEAPAYANAGPGAAKAAQVEALQALVDLESGERERLGRIESDLLAAASGLRDRVWLWTPAMRVRGQVLNALGRYDDALSILAPLFDICIERGWVRQAIQTGAVLAISHHGRGDQSAAVRTLEQVLTYAEPHGFLRSILDAGAGIDQVIEAALKRRREERHDTAYLNRLLKIAREERQRGSAASATQRGLVEPLSEREIEVLRLIAAGYSNAEIADEIYVVVGTVKAHAHNIYTKLGVRNRTQAIKRARELGLVE